MVYRLRILLNLLRQFGIDPISFLRGICAIPRFFKEAARFRLSSTGYRVQLIPALQDYRATAGSADGHYFWQDLLCARWIYRNNPKRHFDVGSRVDGFIAHLLSFREVTVLDIRPNHLNLDGLSVVIGNAQESLGSFKDKFESVSSLHSIEHFGLGRYGDSLDAEGHTKGLFNIAGCVTLGGNLYVSFPIGEDGLEFNSQRIISPSWPIALLKDFELKDFVLIPWKGHPVLI